MPILPSRNTPSGEVAERQVEIEVFQQPVTYNQETNSYVGGVTVGPDDRVSVLDFTETWTRESGILTVSVARG
jgi:hypothetical protein